MFHTAERSLGSKLAGVRTAKLRMSPTIDQPTRLRGLHMAPLVYLPSISTKGSPVASRVRVLSPASFNFSDPETCQLLCSDRRNPAGHARGRTRRAGARLTTVHSLSVPTRRIPSIELCLNSQEGRVLCLYPTQFRTTFARLPASWVREFSNRSPRCTLSMIRHHP
jgi:hypothetical protein